MHFDDSVGTSQRHRTTFVQPANIWQNKSTFAQEAIDGHLSTAHKDVLRIVTGDYLSSDRLFSSLPKRAAKSVLTLSKVMDEAQLQVVDVLCEKLFFCKSGAEVGEKYNIPFLSGNKAPCSSEGKMEDSTSSEGDIKLKKFGLLDVMIPNYTLYTTCHLWGRGVYQFKL